MSPFSLQSEKYKSRLELSPPPPTPSGTCSFFSPRSSAGIVFNQRRLSNLRSRVSIWQPSECEWIVCVCVCWWRGGDYCMQCIVGNVVLQVSPTVLPFCRVTLCIPRGLFLLFLSTLWLVLHINPLRQSGAERDLWLRKHLSGQRHAGWRSDYEGFMQGGQQDNICSSHRKYLHFFFKNYGCMNKLCDWIKGVTEQKMSLLLRNNFHQVSPDCLSSPSVASHLINMLKTTHSIWI